MIDPISLGINAILTSAGAGTFGTAISAGLSSFLTSKLLGASTRDSIKAGLLGGAGATATGKLGEYLSRAGTSAPLADTIAAGAPGAGVVTSTPTGFGADAVLKSAAGTSAPKFSPDTIGTGLTGNTGVMANLLGDSAKFGKALMDNQALIGYGIGSFLWWSSPSTFTPLANFFFNIIPGFSSDVFYSIKTQYEQWNFWIIFTAGFTPIPFKIFTITAGAFDINFILFIIASTVSR